MKSELKGFVEGTTHVTTGDKMKAGDHRRDKRNCFFYKSGYCELLSRKCTGSSHCDHYNDGIKVKIIEPTIPNIHTYEKLLMSFLQTLRNEINYKSLEGQYICKMILKKYRLTKEKIEDAKRQIETFEYKKSTLTKEINSYNENLKNKCILIGLLIITAPFCYSYYKNNSRKIDAEITALKQLVVDDKLQHLVALYNIELNLYKQSSEMSKRKKRCFDENENFFARAVIAYNNKEFERFFEMILKSIKDSTNISAIRFLANLFQDDTFFEKDETNHRLLLLYASYLGDKNSSNTLANLILKKHKDSKIGKKFLEKGSK